MNDESELGGVAGELSADEAAALLEVVLHPALRRLLEACLEARDAE